MSSRQRQERKKIATTQSCACCEEVDADPDINKYHRRKRRRRKQPILQMVIIVAVVISLALVIPILVTKCISTMMVGGEYTDQRRRKLRQSIPIVDPPSPKYHQINVNYPGLKSLTNTTSYVYTIDNFISEDECDFLIEAAQDCLQTSTVTGSSKEAGRRISTARTSWTCRLHRDDLPILMNSVIMKLTNKPLEHIEHPQLARYESTQQFKPHYDAYDEKNPTLKDTLEDGGNRLVTILIYLNDVEVGGATQFPSLNIEVQPKRGMAVVFFPATVEGKLDRGALHAALPAVDTKYVAQIWVRQSEYVGDVLSGSPDKRLSIVEPIPITERKSWWRFF